MNSVTLTPNYFFMKKIKGLKITISLDAFAKILSEKKDCNKCGYYRDFKCIDMEKINQMLQVPHKN